MSPFGSLVGSSDIHVVGTGEGVLVPDFLAAFGDSEEDEQGCELLTDLAYGGGPAGDAVYRRLYVTVEWENGVSLTITPVVDEVDLTQFRLTFNRTGAGREAFVVPMVARGKRLAMRAVSPPPTGKFAIEVTEIAYQGALNTFQPNAPVGE